MRTEKEMMDLILSVAKSDNHIQAVLMNGSRTNPSVQKDVYQDYDIAYMVSDVAPFWNNISWIENKFGKPSIMQLPELMTHPLLPPDNDGHFTYLMLFPDGNRIDLSVVAAADENLKQYDCLTVCLLDKTGVVPNYPAPSDRDYIVTRPDEKIFSDTCNEFWWCMQNVAKSIVRDELPSSMEMYNHYVRDMLNQMVEWHIGITTGFSVSVGKMGKYFRKYLPKELWDTYAKTYCDSNYEHFWSAISIMCDLFRTLSLKVAEHFGFTYRKDEEEGIRVYMKMVKEELL